MHFFFMGAYFCFGCRSCIKNCIFLAFAPLPFFLDAGRIKKTTNCVLFFWDSSCVEKKYGNAVATYAKKKVHATYNKKNTKLTPNTAVAP